MGMSMNTGNGGSRRRRRSSQPMSEINVTPFIDVMLVLLIIFMVTAPMLTAGVPIDLPESAAAPLNTQKEPLTVSIKPDGRIFIKDDQVSFDRFIAELNRASENNLQERILVRGDMNANYGAVVRVMGAINGAGYKKLSLITRQAESQ